MNLTCKSNFLVKLLSDHYKAPLSTLEILGVAWPKFPGIRRKNRHRLRPQLAWEVLPVGHGQPGRPTARCPWARLSKAYRQRFQEVICQLTLALCVFWSSFVTGKVGITDLYREKNDMQVCEGGKSTQVQVSLFLAGLRISPSCPDLPPWEAYSARCGLFKLSLL